MIVAEASAAICLLHPIRRQIVERLTEPASASGLSPFLGIPRQHLNYHLHELEKEGLVELVEERSRGSVKERIYRRAAEAFHISPGALGPIGVSRSTGLHADLMAIGSALFEDGAALAARGPAPTLAIQTEFGFASPTDRAGFATELAAEIERLARKYHDPQSTDRYRVVAIAHPAVGS